MSDPVSDPVSDQADDVVSAEQDAAAAAEPAPARLRMRRAPRYLPFGLTGTALGVIAGIVVALTFSGTSDYATYSTQTIAGYFAAIFALLGAVVGLGLAVLLDRRRS